MRCSAGIAPTATVLAASQPMLTRRGPRAGRSPGPPSTLSTTIGSISNSATRPVARRATRSWSAPRTAARSSRPGCRSARSPRRSATRRAACGARSCVGPADPAGVGEAVELHDVLHGVLAVLRRARPASSSAMPLRPGRGREPASTGSPSRCTSWRRRHSGGSSVQLLDRPLQVLGVPRRRPSGGRRPASARPRRPPAARCGHASTGARPSTTGRGRCRARRPRPRSRAGPSWRRWYDVAPVLRPSRVASVVAVAGPSMPQDRRASAAARGWVSALSASGVGVIEVRSTGAGYTAKTALQRTFCKESYASSVTGFGLSLRRRPRAGTVGACRSRPVRW